MNSWLLMYIIGFVLMFSLMLIANRGIKFKEIKIKSFLKAIAICFGSWISMYVIAIMLVKTPSTIFFMKSKRMAKRKSCAYDI